MPFGMSAGFSPGPHMIKPQTRAPRLVLGSPWLKDHGTISFLLDLNTHGMPSGGSYGQLVHALVAVLILVLILLGLIQVTSYAVACQ